MTDAMIRTQVHFPDPLYQRLKEIAERQDWLLSEVMRKAAEHFVERFPVTKAPPGEWQFPILDCGGDFPVDPAMICAEADAVGRRGGD